MNGKKIAIGATAIAVLALGGGGVAAAEKGHVPDTGGKPSGQQETTSLEKAKSLALDHIKGGRVTGTEVGDEEGAYEVEVTRKDGSQVDVHFDNNLKILSTPADHEGADSKDGSNDSGD